MVYKYSHINFSQGPQTGSITYYNDYLYLDHELINIAFHYEGAEDILITVQDAEDDELYYEFEVRVQVSEKKNMC